MAKAGSERGETFIALRAMREAMAIVRDVKFPPIESAVADCPFCEACLSVLEPKRPRKVQCPRCFRILKWNKGFEKKPKPSPVAELISLPPPQPPVPLAYHSGPDDPITKEVIRLDPLPPAGPLPKFVDVSDDGTRRCQPITERAGLSPLSAEEEETYRLLMSSDSEPLPDDLSLLDGDKLRE